MNETNRVIIDTDKVLRCDICKCRIAPGESKVILGLLLPEDNTEGPPAAFLIAHGTCWGLSEK